MKKIVLLTAFCTLAAFGQSKEYRERDPKAIAFLYDVDSLVCHNDTIALIHLLEDFEQKFPKEGLVFRTRQALAKLYAAKGMNQIAISKLESLFDFQIESSPYLEDFSECEGFFDDYFYAVDRNFKIAKALIAIYIKQKDFDKAGVMIAKAKYVYFPGYDCGNGIDLWMSELSLLESDYWLAQENGKAAIDALVPYFDESDVFPKFQQLIIRRYSEKAFRAELENGLATARSTKSFDHGTAMEFSVFAHKFRIFVSKSYGSPKQALEMHPKVRKLMDESLYTVKN